MHDDGRKVLTLHQKPNTYLITRETMDAFKVIIVEDVKLELKGTEQIFHSEIPEAEIIGTAATEAEFWKLMRGEVPHLVLLDLGLGGSTTVGVDICRQLKSRYPSVRVLVFTGEVLNERLWVEVLSAGADGIILKTCLLYTSPSPRDS